MPEENPATAPARLPLKAEAPEGNTYNDLLEPQKSYPVQKSLIHFDFVPACGAVILN